MALTDTEETKVRNLIAAVEAAGLAPAEITATLRIGKLTTEISGIDAQIQNRAAARDAANVVAKQEADALDAQKAAKQAALRALLGGGN